MDSVTPLKRSSLEMSASLAEVPRERMPRFVSPTWAVAVIEQKGRLDGHTETYTDPATGDTMDFGVRTWHNITTITDFAARLNISLVPFSFEGTGGTDYIDYRTGEILPDYTPSDPSTALKVYVEQLEKYPYLTTSFDLPSPVLSDLLLPFRGFVKKYSLQLIVPLVFTYNQGVGDLLSLPTLYVMKLFGLDVIQAIVNGRFVATAQSDNSLVYEHASAALGDSIHLNSRVLAMERGDPDGVEILVSTPSGLTLIRSQEVVLAIPPRLDNLQGWDLSTEEERLFGQFSNAAYYTGVLRNTGIPSNIVSIVNTRNGTGYDLPQLPTTYSLLSTVTPGLISVTFGSLYPIPDAVVEQTILSNVKGLQIPGKGPSNPELAVFSAHVPFECTVPADAIAAGFYQQLSELQGQRHAYYTGAAFHTHDSSLLWQFTEALLPNITAAGGH